jgi:acetyltransferase-like isoleucine patch superfamily enzyme
MWLRVNSARRVARRQTLNPMQRMLYFLWPWRWLRAMTWLARGARVHPSAILLGRGAQLVFGRSTKIGARARLDPGADGRIVAGERVWLSTDVEIETATEVSIGSGTTVQRRCTLNGSTRVGNSCILAPNVFVSSGTHPFRAIPHLPIREQERILDTGAHGLDRPVWIQDDCWLGVNSVVCPGVTIGKGSVVGANAVVTRDVLPYSVVAGSPARVIGQRLRWEPRMVVDPNSENDEPYVLSGRITRASGTQGKAVVVDAATPLQVALAWPVAARYAVRIQCNAREPVTVLAGGVRHSVTLDHSELVLSRELEIHEGFCLCNLALDNKQRNVALEVLRLEVVQV